MQLVHSLENARDAWRFAQTNDEYVDVHSWRFTPESFRLVIDDLSDLGLLELGITEGPTGAANEFCACLQRRSNPHGDRISRLAAIEKAQH
jgi:hypothetical protein